MTESKDTVIGRDSRITIGALVLLVGWAVYDTSWKSNVAHELRTLNQDRWTGTQQALWASELATRNPQLNVPIPVVVDVLDMSTK